MKREKVRAIRKLEAIERLVNDLENKPVKVMDIARILDMDPEMYESMSDFVDAIMVRRHELFMKASS